MQAKSDVAIAHQDVLGLPIAITDYDGVTELILKAIADEQALSVCPVAVHAVMEAAVNPDLAAIYAHVDLVLADGHGVRHAVNFLAGTRVLRDRVHGPDLAARLLRRMSDTGGSVFLYGGDEALSADLAGALELRFPGLKVAGRIPSRFRPNTVAEFTDDIASMRASGADVVLVGLGTPRQDLFIFQTVSEVQRPMLALGVGFAYFAGRTKDAPTWMKDHSLQWMYRLAQDPRRLWHRYLVLNPLFVRRVLRQKRNAAGTEA